MKRFICISAGKKDPSAVVPSICDVEGEQDADGKIDQTNSNDPSVKVIYRSAKYKSAKGWVDPEEGWQPLQLLPSLGVHKELIGWSKGDYDPDRLCFLFIEELFKIELIRAITATSSPTKKVIGRRGGRGQDPASLDNWVLHFPLSSHVQSDEDLAKAREKKKHIAGGNKTAVSHLPPSVGYDPYVEDRVGGNDDNYDANIRAAEVQRAGNGAYHSASDVRYQQGDTNNLDPDASGACDGDGEAVSLGCEVEEGGGKMCKAEAEEEEGKSEEKGHKEEGEDNGPKDAWFEYEKSAEHMTDGRAAKIQTIFKLSRKHHEIRLDKYLFSMD